LAKQGKVYWWDRYIDPTRGGDPTAPSCTHPIFWADKGQTPTVPGAATPQVLAQLAYARIRDPATKVRLSPAGPQTVNLNTWAWAGRSAFKPVSVTASVPVLGISATTTATPVALHLDPGTEDANVYPGSGDCPTKADGGIGTPYTAADGNSVPPSRKPQ
jgi:enoyl reductase